MRTDIDTAHDQHVTSVGSSGIREGVELLRAANIDVVEIAELADEVKQINAHLLGAN